MFIYLLELSFWKFTFGMKQIGHKMTDTKTSYFLNWKEWDLLHEIFIPIKLLVQKLSTYNGWWLKEHATSCPSSIFTLLTDSIIIQLFDNKHHIIFLTFWQIGLWFQAISNIFFYLESFRWTRFYVNCKTKFNRLHMRTYNPLFLAFITV